MINMTNYMSIAHNFYYNIFSIMFDIYCVYYYFKIDNNCTLNLDDACIDCCTINLKFYNNILILYFTIDAFIKAIDGDYLFILHHVVPIIMLLLFDINKAIHIYIIKMLVITEFSSIILVITYVTKGTIKQICLLLFSIVFLIHRTYIYYYLNYETVDRLNNNTDLITHISIMIMTTLHVYWSYKIIHKLIRTFFSNNNNKND